MTKPLSIFLELLGAVILLSGIAPPVNYLGVVFGILLILIGAKGIRDRLEKDRQYRSAAADRRAWIRLK